ncbi:MAG: hypothetical protein WBB86_01035 [Candidatus Omnitrophota bacterium]
MSYDNEKFKRTSGFLVIVGLFLFAYLFKGLDSFYQSKLSAPYGVFQRSAGGQVSEMSRSSVTSDVKFVTAVFSIAAHFLIEGKGKETLAKAIRDEFRNTREFLTGIDLDGVSSDGQTVIMPFTRQGALYEAKIFARHPGRPAGDAGAIWDLPQGFGMEIVPAALRRSDVGRQEEIRKTGAYEDVRKDMRSIHEMNMDLIPPVEADKVMWHVIPAELIPVSIRSDFVAMINRMNRKYPDLREKIKIVTERQDFYAVVSDLAGDSANIIDAAVASKESLKDLPEGVKALVFDGELGDFRQLEGIIAALRALQQEDIEALMNLYMLMTGENFEGDIDQIAGNIDDPSNLADFLTFSLSPIRIRSVQELERLNKEQLRFIYAA